VPALSSEDFEKLQNLDTCTVSNAIERLKVRLRNEGVVCGGALHCRFPDFKPMLGYAATGRMRSTSAPVYGRAYHENMNWWRYVTSIPEPRIMVVQDVDEKPGAGALVGELHALIGLAIQCIGYVTNGSVRDLPAVEALGFHLFSKSVAVSHMYAHISDSGEPVEIGGLKIRPGDLIHGDRHGVHLIPLSIASEIPAMAAEILREERELREFCRSPRFSLRRLDKKLQSVSRWGGQSWPQPPFRRLLWMRRRPAFPAGLSQAKARPTKAKNLRTPRRFLWKPCVFIRVHPCSSVAYESLFAAQPRYATILPKPTTRIALVTVLAAALVSCGGQTAANTSPQAVPAREVGVVAVTRKNLQSTLVVSSELVPFQQIDVYAKEAGFVKQLNVD
jgi:4-hydroxy-4-methyl-2-oxoglutarate aldolase